MKAVIFAYHDMGCVGLNALLNAGFVIVAVFTHADAAGETISTVPLHKRRKV